MGDAILHRRTLGFWINAGKLAGALTVLLVSVGCGAAATPAPAAPPVTATNPTATNPTAAGPTAAPTSVPVVPATGPSPATAAPVSSTPSSAGVPPTATPRPDINEHPDVRNYQNQGWTTDFSRSSVSLDEIFSGGVSRDGIPPLDAPTFVNVAEADEWLEALEPVILLEREGDARAYPLQIMTWHEIVNDQVGGTPVSVTFCPLCNSAITFDRRLDGKVYDFGTSGNLRNSDLVMWDRQTQSWWQQFTGEAIVGELTGSRLTFLPSVIVSWEDFKTFHPDGQVLSRDTGFNRRYGDNPYVGYDRVDLPPFLFFGETDGRLLPKERVAAVSADGVDVAFPFSALEQEWVINYRVGGQDVAVFFKPGARSALDQQAIGDSREVGSTAMFVPTAGEQRLTFAWENGKFVDQETGSVWDLQGQAVEGPLTGEALLPVVHANHFWFAWGAFKPETLVYQGAGG